MFTKIVMPRVSMHSLAYTTKPVAKIFTGGGRVHKQHQLFIMHVVGVKDIFSALQGVGYRRGFLALNGQSRRNCPSRGSVDLSACKNRKSYGNENEILRLRDVVAIQIKKVFALQ